jgi:hypothetical protein
VEICFESDKAVLKVKWSSGNSSLATIEYIDYWITILKHVEVLKPLYLLIDASDFEYRILAEVNIMFNDISQKLRPENIAIVASKSLLGSKTIENLLQNCPVRGYNIFNNSNEGIIWVESRKPLLSK